MTQNIAPLMMGLRSQTLGQDERDFMAKVRPASAIVFARNIATPEQTRELTAALAEVLPGKVPLVAVDQEGGRVQRLTFGGRLPAAGVFGAWHDADSAAALEAVRLCALLLAAQLRDVGATWMLAPVLDVRHAETHGIIGDRAFHNAPAVVAKLAAAYVEGIGQGGCLPCMKHAPGHGRATADSHKELPKVCAPEDALRTDMQPFAALAPTMPFAMTAHVCFDAWDDKPATCSPKVLAMMRRDWNFGGLIVADDLGMEALAGDYLQRGHAALGAGCDMVIASFSKIMHGMAGTVFDEETYRAFVEGYDLPPLNDRAAAYLDNLTLPPAPQPEQVEVARARLRALWDDGAGRMGYSFPS
ncbi:MAG: beta-N-acetylhexosaminidase [Pseudomonadaceae bacterium]|nr:beta-N-acetylhexosaminidase [Pseudomonadaceae bacterium]